MRALQPEVWRVVRELFEAALAQPAERRRSFVDESCRDDGPMRDDVLSLLEWHERASGFLETPAVELLGHEAAEGSAAAAAPDPNIGRTIGPYLIESIVGHGGMGTVYLARRVDRAFDRRVAVKMIRRGMDSDVVIRRFEGERQILASLDHPHIARLYDGGTTPDGLPYFVMEYVEGEPITHYCDRHGLGTRERLAMFRTVCGAVGYAHANLVIHRDLKPANILVAPDGQPRLLDFGIAKLFAGTDASDAPAATLISALTPDYASPEQVRGHTVTTATDIYSLGVVLYELLAGSRPFAARAGSLEDIVRSVCDTDPAPPSAAVHRTSVRAPRRVAKELRGDLDTIVLRALRKEPERRYSSAQALSDDIGKYLDGRPVAARGDAFTYRAAKFAARHWAGMLVAALFLVSALAGVILVVRQSQIAEEQRRRAERRFADVRQLAGSILFEVQDAIQYLPGATRARELVSKRALEYLDSLAAEAGDDPTLQQELADAYRRLGDVLGNAREANLGDGAGALASYGKGLALLETLAQSRPHDVGLQRETARTLIGVGDAYLMMRRLDEALASYRRALTLGERLVAAAPGDRVQQRMLATTHARVGDVQLARRQRDLARESLNHAIAILDRLARDRTDVDARRLLARSYKRLGVVEAEIGNLQQSLALHGQALTLNESLAAADPLNTSLRNEVAMTHLDLGGTHNRGDNLVDALRSYRRAEAITRSMAEADPSNAQARWLLGLELNAIGSVLTVTRREQAAVASHTEALTLLEGVAAGDPANATFQYNIANTHQLLGDAHATAARRLPSGAAKVEARKACSSYRQSAAVFDAMRKRGTLTASLVADAEQVTGHLAQCDARPRAVSP